MIEHPTGLAATNTVALHVLVENEKREGGTEGIGDEKKGQPASQSASQPASRKRL
jgi:hypothetical protein